MRQVRHGRRRSGAWLAARSRLTRDPRPRNTPTLTPIRDIEGLCDPYRGQPRSSALPGRNAQDLSFSRARQPANGSR
jgi:hypothetical protein